MLRLAVTQIGSVLRQALITFTCKEDLFFENLQLLKAALEKTTAEDVNLHPQFMTESLWKQPSKAPVTYVDIFENHLLSVGIFILKPGMKLPLHNHPEMYGLIKVIAGKIKVTSFSLNTEKTLKALNNLEETLPVKHLIVEKNESIIADTSSETCCLEPKNKNLHEIESIDGPAAFLDILSPPYETQIKDNGKRKCAYYRLKEELVPSVFLVEEINSPSWFWSDSFPYDGPELL